MGKKGHSEEEILRVLREAESGDTVVEICRKHGISQQTFYLWKKKYAGLGLNELRELRQLRQLRDENAKLKRLVADLSLDRHILQEIGARPLRPRARRELAEWVQQVHRLSQRRVAGLIPVDPMALRYLHHRDPQEALRVRLRELAGSRVRYGYRRLTVLLRREGWEVNAKRIYRLYAEEDLQRGLYHLYKVGVGQLRNSYEPGREASSKKVASVPLCEDTELVGDFGVEAREHLSDIEGQMLTLERDPSDMEVLQAVFRAFHTIKGLAGFLDFAVVQTVAHEVETLLDLARNEKLVIHTSIVDVVLEVSVLCGPHVHLACGR
jgi:transposase-like protein/HPt (histidine-containing phosphotransfer) domain-containing protein